MTHAWWRGVFAASLIAFIGLSAQADAPACRSVFQSTSASGPRQYKVPGFEYSIVEIKEVFDARDPLFIGFGKPNVFLVAPSGKGTEQLAAKSLRLAPAKVVDTRGLVQAGIFFRLAPERLNPEMVDALRAAMHERAGTKSWTCVNSVCATLDRAGFTSGGRDLRGEYFPIPLMERIVRDGLEWNGQKIEVDIVNASSKKLSDFIEDIQDAQRRTLSRHAFRHWSRIERKFNLTAHIVRVRDRTREMLGILWRKDERPQARSDLSAEKPEIWESTPSSLGRVMNALGGEHKFIEIDLAGKEAGRFLPAESLTAYEKKTQSFMTTLKKDVLFSPTVVNFLFKHLRSGRVAASCPGGCEKMSFLPQRPGEVFNFVLTGDRLVLTQVNVKHPMVDWVLSKHVLMSGYHSDVRFAGEVWREADGRVRVNNNSGTYAPASEKTSQAIEVLRRLFPQTEFIEAPSVQ